MKITVRTITKETYVCDLEPTSSILTLKQELSKMSLIEVEYNRLIYSGKILQDDSTLISIGYSPTDFIVMMKKRYKDPPITNEVKTEPKQSTEQKQDTNKDSNQNAQEQEQEQTTVKDDNHVNNQEGKPDINTEEQDDDYGEDSQDRDEKLLSPIQIMQLINILTTDPTISQILELHPQLRTELRNPQVLLELLRRMKHPIVKEFTKHTFSEPGQVDRSAIGGKNQIQPKEEEPEKEDDTIKEDDTEEDGEDDAIQDAGDLPEVVHITQSEFNELNGIKNQVKEFIGELSITDAQLNGIIYEVYRMFNKDADATLAFVINRIIDEGL